MKASRLWFSALKARNQDDVKGTEGIIGFPDDRNATSGTDAHVMLMWHGNLMHLLR